MGKCILSFDQIEIVEQKSDGRYSDNDWMMITWFVDDKVIRTDKFPLLSLNGGVGLKSGDGITPFTSEVDCLDDDIVTAAYNVVNLGSTDLSDQADAAAQIANNVSQALTQAYLKAVEVYLEYFSDIPFSSLLADQIADFAPDIVSTVGAAYTDVIVPLLNDLIQEIQILIGRPNCNGDVFHDVAVFKPGQPVPDSTSGTKYTAASVNGLPRSRRHERVHNIASNSRCASAVCHHPSTSHYLLRAFEVKDRLARTRSRRWHHQLTDGRGHHRPIKSCIGPLRGDRYGEGRCSLRCCLPSLCRPRPRRDHPRNSLRRKYSCNRAPVEQSFDSARRFNGDPRCRKGVITGHNEQGSQKIRRIQIRRIPARAKDPGHPASPGKPIHLHPRMAEGRDRRLLTNAPRRIPRRRPRRHLANLCSNRHP